jgi:endoglucanase
MQKSSSLLKYLVLSLSAIAIPSMAQAPAVPNSVTNIITNGDFQNDQNADGNPDGWGAPKGPLSYVTEGENRFARLTSQKPGQMAMLYRLITIPDGVKAVELKWKQRTTNLKPGKQAWFDARIMMEWKDAAGVKMKGAPSAPYARKDSDWVEKSKAFLVPEGARTLEFMPALFQVNQGTFDLDDLVLTPTDPEPLIAAAKERAEAMAVKAAQDAEKRDAKLAKTVAADGSYFPNGDLETDANGDGLPDGWSKPKEGSGVTYETEGNNRFLRLTQTEPFKMLLYYRPVMLPSTVKAVEFTWKQRISNLKPGKQNFHDARIMTDFINGSSKKVKGGPVLSSAKRNTEGWVEKSKSVLVPEGAAGIAMMPTLFQVETGTYDLDDLKVKAIEPGALIAEQSAAEEEKKRINIAYEAPDPTKFPSPLHVQGNKILNAEGKEVWLQGVNIMSLDWSPTGERVLLSTKVAIEDWKSNIIRLAVKEHYWFGKDASQKDGGKAYRELVDAVINLTANRGAYVLLDLHRYRAAKQEHADFWTDAATRYKNHPALIFDLMNEPHDTSWEIWQKGGFVPVKKQGVDETAFLSEEEKIKNNAGFRSIGMQGLLDAVRATGAKNVCLAGGLDYGYDLAGVTKGFALDDKGGNGLIYGSHIYPWKKGWQAKFLDAAAKYPILSGENGGNNKKMGFMPESQQEDAATWVPAFLGMVQKYKIHWTGFSFHPKASPVMISDWDYTPTPEWGAFAKRALAGEKFPAPDRLR